MAKWFWHMQLDFFKDSCNWTLEINGKVVCKVFGCSRKTPLCECDDYFRLLGLYIVHIKPSRSKYVSCQAHRGIDTIRHMQACLKGIMWYAHVFTCEQQHMHPRIHFWSAHIDNTELHRYWLNTDKNKQCLATKGNIVFSCQPDSIVTTRWSVICRHGMSTPLGFIQPSLYTPRSTTLARPSQTVLSFSSQNSVPE